MKFLQIIFYIEKWQEGIMVHFISSVISGLNTSLISLPVDIVKTRMQNMQIANGIPEYSSSWVNFTIVFFNILYVSTGCTLQNMYE